jgi:hypothetical protein
MCLVSCQTTLSTFFMVSLLVLVTCLAHCLPTLILAKVIFGGLCPKKPSDLLLDSFPIDLYHLFRLNIGH